MKCVANRNLKNTKCWWGIHDEIQKGSGTALLTLCTRFIEPPTSVRDTDFHDDKIFQIPICNFHSFLNTAENKATPFQFSTWPLQLTCSPSRSWAGGAEVARNMKSRHDGITASGSRGLDLNIVNNFYLNLNVNFNCFCVTYQFIIRRVAYESDFGPITEKLKFFNFCQTQACSL